MFRLTKQADYGIVLMTHLAQDGDRRLTAPELAAETQIPLPMVSKTLRLLVREGLLVSHRGAQGGYALERAAREITVAAMISALDGPIAFTECIDDTPGECSQEAVCRLRSNWQMINNSVREALEGVTLEMLALPLHPQLVQLGRGTDTSQGL
nr:putative HTH-type transcriptional regulator rrf2-like [Nerophis lumbriciformis]